MSESCQRKEPVVMPSIADLGLGVRARKRLLRSGIDTVDKLILVSGDELLDCRRNFGIVSLRDIRQQLAKFGLCLRGDE